MGIFDLLSKGVGKLFSGKPKEEIKEGVPTASELGKNFTSIKAPEKQLLTDTECEPFIYQLFEDEYVKKNLNVLGRDSKNAALLKIIRDLYDGKKWTDPSDDSGFALCTEIIENRVKRSTLEKYIKEGDNQTKQLFSYLKSGDITKIDGALKNYYNEIQWLYYIVTSDNEHIIKTWSSGGEKSLDKYIDDHTDSEKYLSTKNSIIEQGKKGYDIRSCVNDISDCLQVAKRSKDDITPKNIAQYNVLVMFIYGLGLLDHPSPILIDPMTKEKVMKIS